MEDSSIDQVSFCRRGVPGVLAAWLGVLLLFLLLFQLRGSLVVFLEYLGGDTVEELLRVDAEETPGQIQGIDDGARFIGRLRDEGSLELLEELEGEFVLRRQGFFTDDGFHRRGVATNGVLGIQLVRDVAVVSARTALFLRQMRSK